MPKIYGLIFILFSFNSWALIDSNATQEAVDIYNNLKSASGRYMYYGEFIERGVSRVIETYKITEKYPAVFSCDYDNTASVSFDFKKNKHDMICHSLMGGIIMMSWTMKNFVTDGNCRDTNGSPVTNVLPNGSARTAYLTALDAFADDMKSVKIPLIFRPFHECDTHSFWWGTEGCTDAEFVLLWRDLVTYLRDVKGVHNLIYCYAPEIIGQTTYKGARFPGVDYIDIYGIDRYSNSDDISSIITSYGIVSDAAISDGKVFAITEGLRKISDYPKSDYWTWWTNQILNDPKVSKASFICNWSAPNWGCKKGRSDEADFINMSNNPRIKFLQYKKGIILSGVSY